MYKWIRILMILLILILAGWLLYKWERPFQPKVQLTDDVIVERIENIGKLELVKYSMKDVIERKELRMFLPDQRVLFVAAGEVTGCIDLQKITPQDIVRHPNDSLTVVLPEPEICYVKIDHQRSKVYDVSGAWLPGDTQNLVEGIYKVAEQRLWQNAKEMDVLGKTKENALIIFKPMLENMLGMKVSIVFKNNFSMDKSQL
ncbi:Protein of unknown function [bacterium A37T11]|nr:Protein of unknown function [bacterium A37T11]